MNSLRDALIRIGGAVPDAARSASAIPEMLKARQRRKTSRYYPEMTANKFEWQCNAPDIRLFPHLSEPALRTQSLRSQMLQMHNIIDQSFRLGIAAMIVGMSSLPAYAYLDPGTGSLLLQVLLGGIAGATLAGKLLWHRLLSILGLKETKDSREVADDQSAGADGRGAK